MCGIIAYTGSQNAATLVLEGLRRLEYRGYDSAGIAVYSRKRLRCIKAAGRLDTLEARVPATLSGHSAIGHTRWATHGAPTDENAHPHLDAEQRIAVVHNGIVENASSLRDELQSAGVPIRSSTDTELIAHLIAREDGALDARVAAVLQRLQGTCGLAVIDRDSPGTLVVARLGSPVILGIGQHEMLAASDLAALTRHTREVIHLEDGELATLTPDNFVITHLDTGLRHKQSTTLTQSVEDYDRGGHPHYLYREIVDQPEVLEQTLGGRLDQRFATVRLGGLNLNSREMLAIRRVRILGCGSALYAGMAGAAMIEHLARLPAFAESAAEFRYRHPVLERDTLYIAVSQSGETYDTLAALREIQRRGGFVLGVVNSVGSTIAREVDGGVYMHAGPEVSVASTKAYSAMLVVFALLAVAFGRLHDVSPQRGSALLEVLAKLPEAVREVVRGEMAIKRIALACSQVRSAFFIGRTTALPIALEGAQKLKELSYIHAEAYAASELKHGPLALVDHETPCIVVLPDSNLFDKSLGTVEEIRAREAPVIALTDAPPERLARLDVLADHVIRVPRVDPLIQGVVMGVALQLFAYHCACALGRDVDRPRNLAKSVTVE